MQKTKTILHLVVFGSPLSTRESIFNDHQVILKRIEATYDVNFLFPEELDKEAPKGVTMVFVGSGGVEEMVKASIDRLPPYVMLIADGLKNSLAASLEILSWMRLEGRQGRVVHGDTDFMMEGISDYMAGYEALGKLKGTRVGVIGHPSGWLIASGVDYADVRRSWGTELIDLSLEEVVSNYRSIIDDEVKNDTEDFVRHASGMKEPSVADVVKAMRLCRALQKMVDRYKLSAFTLNCFDLIPPTGTTGCVALAMLNDRGIPAGCEGDIQTLLTMLAVQAATGEVAFMANPSMITNNARHEMIFAHCTIAPCMTDSYTIRTHYESQSGVALEGTMSPGSYTIVKSGGRRMERFFVSNAELLECTANPNMCRTQLHLRLQEPLDYFLHRSIGNHHVIVKGNCSNILTSVFTMLGAKKD